MNQLSIIPLGKLVYFMRKRSISLKGHRTSISLEVEFWHALDDLAACEKRSLPHLISEIDHNRIKQIPPPGLASALRVYVLEQIRGRLTQ